MDRRIGTILAGLTLAVFGTSFAQADCGCGPQQCDCAPSCQPAMPYYQAPSMGPMGSEGPSTPMPMDSADIGSGDQAPNVPLPQLPSPASSFASSSQLASSSESVGFRDATIGDFFGSAARIQGASFGTYLPPNGFNLPLAGSDRRLKLTENISPLPVDRWFVNYNHFSQPLADINNNELDVDRVTLGLEKTVLNNAASVELRLPLIGGLSSTQDVRTLETQDAVEFGNVTLTFKGVLWQCGDEMAVTGGLGVNMPTGSSASVFDAGGNQIVSIDNQAVHLLPFLAVYKKYSSRTWAIGIVQFDFDANGNEFVFNNGQNSSVYQDQTMMFLDASVGHWFYENQCGCSWIQRAAVIGELHYATTLNDTDVAQAGPVEDSDVVRNPFNRLDILNGTAGLRFQLGRNYLLTTAAVFPLREREEAQFDSEIAILVTRRF